MLSTIALSPQCVISLLDIDARVLSVPVGLMMVGCGVMTTSVPTMITAGLTGTLPGASDYKSTSGIWGQDHSPGRVLLSDSGANAASGVCKPFCSSLTLALSTSLPVCLSVRPSVCLPACLPACLSVCPFVCSFVFWGQRVAFRYTWLHSALLQPCELHCH